MLDRVYTLVFTILYAGGTVMAKTSASLMNERRRLKSGLALG